MIVKRLSDFKAGWIVGAFEPTLHHQPHVEVAVKRYRKGDVDRAHVHKVGTEITVLISGRARMGDVVFQPDDVVVLAPGEPMPGDWVVEEDGTTTVCVKYPSAPGDKYPIS